MSSFGSKRISCGQSVSEEEEEENSFVTRVTDL
jgi:hypothetical protein